MPDHDLLTVDELARNVGMTVRNVRAHQSRGLLPAPTVRGRTGYYDADHVARLELIKDMQAEGFNLKAIQHVLASTPIGSGQEALAFRRALLEPWIAEEPEIVDTAGLAEMMGVDAAAGAGFLAEAVKLGLLRPLDDDRFEIPSPALIQAGAAVVALGIPLEAVQQITRTLAKHTDAVATAFVRLYLEHVWRPFAEAEQPEERWPFVQDALAKLSPLASQALLATFGVVMAREVEAAVGHEVIAHERRTRPDAARRSRGSRQPRRSAAAPVGSGRRRKS